MTHMLLRKQTNDQLIINNFRTAQIYCCFTLENIAQGHSKSHGF